MESNTLTLALLRRHDRTIKFRLQFCFEKSPGYSLRRLFLLSHFALMNRYLSHNLARKFSQN
jgi:hypothetical protein